MAAVDCKCFEQKLEAALVNSNFKKGCQIINELAQILDENSFLNFCDSFSKPIAATSILDSFHSKELNLATLHRPGESPYHQSERKSISISPSTCINREHLAQDDQIFDLLQKPGYERLVYFLLQRQSTLSLSSEGDTVLHIVAKHRMVPMLELLVHSKWLQHMMQCCNKQGFLPLHEAARSSFHHFFHLFYPERSKPKERRTSCFEACSEASAAGFKSYSYGGCHSQQAGDKIELFKNSCTSCKFECDQSLIKIAYKLSIDINTKTCFVEDSFSHSAIQQSRPRKKRKTCLSICLEDMLFMSDSAQEIIDKFNFCKVLLRAGARGVNFECKGLRISDQKWHTYFELSPLHLAAGLGSVKLTNLFLANGADPGLCLGPKRMAATQLALERAHSEVALVLLNPDLYQSPDFFKTYVNSTGDTLFHSAVAGQHLCRIEVLERLHQLSCPLDKPNNKEIRPLDLAISLGHLPAIQNLLNLKAELVNVQMYHDSEAYPALHLASTSGNLDLCRLLLFYGANIRACGYKRNYTTACFRAFKFDCPEIGVFLCENSSRSFTLTEKHTLQLEVSKLEPNLSIRLRQRLENVPKLTLTCLDVIRQLFIQKYYCFKYLDKLPLPNSLVKALRYEV
ncbi:poly [ADP-ribose] polymerase [Plakobranchus ocellatus]|uniref:Poly [ADP-ribose] polymerase n=1 Tax=Plakobranchus ocellatus TaxID=259542 RepID=A0AAV3Y665_9GAST|nr:poly [ADP-ribose] polymerase [Plakobranchus ocellatus]